MSYNEESHELFKFITVIKRVNVLYLYNWTVADPGFANRGARSSAEGASIESPKAARTFPVMRTDFKFVYAQEFMTITYFKILQK